MTRAEHMAWCKKRALEYVDAGELSSAYASMGNDLQSHPETANHAAFTLGITLLLGGMLNSQHEMRRFIEGFN